MFDLFPNGDGDDCKAILTAVGDALLIIALAVVLILAMAEVAQ